MCWKKIHEIHILNTNQGKLLANMHAAQRLREKSGSHLSIEKIGLWSNFTKLEKQV